MGSHDAHEGDGQTETFGLYTFLGTLVMHPGEWQLFGATLSAGARAVTDVVIESPDDQAIVAALAGRADE